MQEIIAAIDVGTTKICALIASVTHDSLGNLSLHLLGMGEANSQGIRRGVVVNVREVTNAIGMAVESCEKDAGVHLSSCYLGITGSHIGTLESRGVSPVDRFAGVSNGDMQRALEGAAAVTVPESQQVIHTIARSWTVDGHGEVYQPLGMQAVRLEVDAHIVTGSNMAVNNLVQCVNAHGIDIDDLVLEPLASNESVLRLEEREMGVAVVDIGGGTTDIAVFINDCLCHTAILDVGGHHLTNDVAIALHAPFETAEELKKRYGHVLPNKVVTDEKIWATVFGERSERSFSRRFVSQVLEARTEEILDMTYDELEETGFDNKLPAGIVFTGGSSQLSGLTELARSTLGVPTRIGYPTNHLPINGLHRVLQTPTYATSVGLLLWGLSRENSNSVHRRFDTDPAFMGNPTFMPNGEWVGQATDWLKNLLPG